MNNVYQKDHDEWLACRVRQTMPIGTVSGTKNSAESSIFTQKILLCPPFEQRALWRILFAVAAHFSKRGGDGGERNPFHKVLPMSNDNFSQESILIGYES
ncbi:hypothetical protein CEXT_767971 [Caerostris extrusa]|uniref:Uncharacterized protein n=1 Tax=Caerostris extrusa TaxID=172846 RepID=A0AAV4V9Y6_CAEEX|nr:hypothetical protein CEXT_767971 [Caerostris extrusa]